MLAGTCSARLSPSQLPVLDGVLGHIRAGIESTMHAANERSAGPLLQYPAAVDAARRQLLFDPQTSGGLLIAISSGRAPGLCEALRASGYTRARVIGEVVEAVPGEAVSIQLAD
jgi:selenide,water dikinase